MELVGNIMIHYGYHKNCKECEDFNVKEVGRLINNIEQMVAKPGYKPLTSNQMKAKADRIRQIGIGIKLSGGEVKSEYS